MGRKRKPAAPGPGQTGTALGWICRCTCHNPAARRCGACDRPRPRAGEAQLVGKRVVVWWPGENNFFRGQVGVHDVSDGLTHLAYDDGDT